MFIFTKIQILKIQFHKRTGSILLKKSLIGITTGFPSIKFCSGDTLQSFGGPGQEHDENKKSESGKSNNNSS